MNRSVTSKSFRRLVVGLEKPEPSPAASISPYPCSDEEMIARYGMQYATPEELRIFPVHRLVIKVVKAKIIKIARSPYLNPGAGIGWIVWAVESYPGSHQFRMFSGDLLHEQYHGVAWERVPDETPVTTLAVAKRIQMQQQWQRQVRGGIRQSLQL